MVKVPSISYIKAINALQRAGFIVVRQKGSHIRLQKRVDDEVIKITVPAHKPIKRSTLSHIIKSARLTVDEFLELL
jgi:predicted RNA binding protein YcfA (HicA-like mRNA interferase family)